MNKESNVYIIIYSTVMVVVVAVLLAVAALSLKDRQDANILNEKKSAILASLGAADQNYDDFINAYAVNAEGEKIEGDVFVMLQDLKGSFEQGQYPVFEAQDGRVVLPITGTGLWGPIWGYIALESDMNTVAGIVLDHSGETPGLGAEIATPAHQAMYKGKQIFEGDEFVSVTLKKGGASEGNTHEVDAISGGTKTSDGVSAMLKNSLENYLPLLGAKKGAATAEEVVAEVEETEESNVQNVEENE
ncbi:MAG: NADH:ubiquinone reductase (Na(+)-transporting) subunit C [Rikenellaceae bacterium]|nr:NADH:ubiquinone reductase (Na(+)-transporting) subunit C [Rikenellaceae bacterium]